MLIYAQKDKGFIKREQVTKNKQWIDEWKLYVPEAIGAGNMETDIVKSIIGTPNTVCSETYILIGPFSNENTTLNAQSYLCTKFFHFMLGLKKSLNIPPAKHTLSSPSKTSQNRGQIPNSTKNTISQTKK